MVKSVFPYKMAPFYPFPDSLDWKFYVSIILALFILISIYFLHKKEKKIAFGLLFFTFHIMFHLQIIRTSNTFLADRYTYLAYLGLFFIYSFGLQWILEKYGHADKLIYSITVMLLCTLGYMNFEQNKIWKNGETLWSHVLKYYPASHYAWKARGIYYAEKGLFEKALNNFTEGISITPYNSSIYYNRGTTFLSMNNNNPNVLRLALADYNKAIQLSPEIGKYYVNRGVTYIQLNMFNNALQDFNAAEKITPTDHFIYHSRSDIYISLGQYNKAQLDLEKYLRLNPINPDMWSRLGMVRRLNLQYENSLNALNRAIQLNANNLSYFSERLKTYYEMGYIQRARNDLRFLKLNGFQSIDPAYERMINQKK
jgi:tetratricopeptide (TPR) repeat protein